MVLPPKTYVLLQPPATVILRKVGPRIFLPTITILWGCTMICFGFIKLWYEMIPLRLVLGKYTITNVCCHYTFLTFPRHLRGRLLPGLRLSSILLVP